jgi:hypothetical protein
VKRGGHSPHRAAKPVMMMIIIIIIIIISEKIFAWIRTEGTLE